MFKKISKLFLSTRRRRFFLWLAIPCLIVLVAGYFFICRFAKSAVIAQLKSINHGPVSVSTVTIGFNQIRVKNIELYSGDDAEPWLTTPRASIDISLWQAITGGTVAPDRISLKRPKLKLDFDADSKLLTKLPQTAVDSEAAIRINMNDAEIEIRQAGRQTLIATGIDLEFEKQAKQISVEVDKLRFLNGMLTATLQQNGSQSNVQLTAESIELNATKLRQMALVPKSYLEGVTVDGAVDAQIGFEFNGDQIKNYSVSIQPQLKRFQIPQFENEITDFRGGSIDVKPDRITITKVNLNVLGGHLLVDGRLDSTDAKTSGRITAVATDAEMVEVCKILDLPVDMKGPVSFTTQLDLEIDSEKFIINGDASGAATAFTIETLPAKRVDTKVRLVDIVKYYDSKRTPRMTGEVLVDCVAKNHDVGKLIAALGTRFDVPVPTVSGVGQTDVHVVVPLDRTLGKPMYWADIAVNSGRKIKLADIEFRDVKTDMTLYPNRYKIKSAKAISSKDEVVEFSGLLDFAKDDELIFTLGKSKLAASLLSHYIDQKNLNLDGELSIEGQLNAKRTESGNIRATGTGKVASEDIEIDRFHLTEASSDLRVDGDQLYFDNLKSKFLDGALSADAELSISKKIFSTKVDLKNAKIQNAVKQFDLKQPLAARGLFHSQARLHLELDPFKFSATGDVNATDVALNELSVQNIQTAFDATDYSLKLSKFESKMLGGVLKGSVELDKRKNLLQIDYDATNLDINDIVKLAVDREPEQDLGHIEFFGRTKGTINPLEFKNIGFGKVKSALVKNEKSEVDVQILGDHEHLILKVTKASVADGELNVTTKIAIDSNASTSLNARLQKIAINKILPKSVLKSIGIRGQVSGEVNLENLQDASSMSGKFHLAGLSSNLDAIRISDIRLDGGIENEQIKLTATGKSLQGQLNATSVFEISQWNSLEKIVADVEFKSGQLRTLADVLQIKLPSKPSGTFDIAAKFTIPTDRIEETTATGQIGINNARLGSTEISPTGQTKFQIESGLMKFSGIDARIGNGFVRGQISWPISSQRTGRVQLDGQRIDVGKLMAFIPNASLDVDGKASFRVRGAIQGAKGDVQLKGAGEFTVKDGTLNRVKWNIRRAPFTWSLNPRRLNAVVQARGTVVSILEGQFKADSRISVGQRINFECTGQVKNLDSSQFKKLTVGQNVFGNQGRLNGKLKIHAKNLRTVKDLRGSFNGTLDRAQAFQLPVIDSVSPYVNRSQIKNRRFEQGRVDLVLQNSKIQVRQISFADPQVQVLIDGGFWLNGRIDLQTIVHIGPNKDDPLRQLVRSPLLASSSPSVALIARIDQILADRLLFFKLTGTYKRPRVQIQTTKILQQEALKFILDKTYNLSGQSNSLLNRSTIRLR